MAMDTSVCRSAICTVASFPTDPPGPGVRPALSSARVRMATSDRQVSRMRSRISCWRRAGSRSSPRLRAASIRRSVRSVDIPPVVPEPMATRSYISMAVAMRQPLFRSPRRLSALMRTSVKNTSLKWVPPSIWWMGRTSTPSESMGTMNIEMPACLGTSGSVRAMMTP